MKIDFIFITIFLLLVITKSQIDQANLNDLYFDVDSDYMNQVISNLTVYFETYVYLIFQSLNLIMNFLEI